MRDYYTYILCSRTGVLYVGMTNDLEHRMFQHKHKLVPGFTAQYNVNRLVHYEVFAKPSEAIEREKQIKGWSCAKKIALIKSTNPQWKDFAAEWEAVETIEEQPRESTSQVTRDPSLR